MNLLYWPSLFVFVSLLTFSGLFRNFFIGRPRDLVACDNNMASRSAIPPLLCGQKIALKNASVAELALVDGISLKSAREIVAYVQRSPQATIADLTNVRGIGPKTLERFSKYFF